MRLLCTCLMLCLFLPVASAQFGINGTYQLPTTPYEDAQVAEITDSELGEYYTSSFAFGVDYWFRPEKFRLEFMPELNFARFTGTAFSAGTFQTDRYGLRLNMNVYLFDFLNDCKCPTFSKQDPVLQKGFFIQLSPGYQLSANRFLPADGGEDEVLQTQNWRLGIGAGIDFGFSDLFTVTPFVRYVREIPADPVNFYSYPTFSDREEPLDLETAEAWTQWEFGLRVGFRFDEGY